MACVRHFQTNIFCEMTLELFSLKTLDFAVPASDHPVLLLFTVLNFVQAQERTRAKSAMDQTSDNLLNGDIHKKESGASY